MKEGAFALIDCLGWKGIWKRTKRGDSAIKKLVWVKKDADYSVDLVRQFLKNFSIDLEIDFTMLSDTIAISSPYINTKQHPEVEDFRKGLTIFSVITLAAKFLQLFILDEPHLALRGCITFGEHSISNGFIVGPAVDEAAENYEIANGAFVWVHPNTAEKYTKYLELRTKYMEPAINRMKKDVNQAKPPIPFDDMLSLNQLELSMPFTIEYDVPIKGTSNLLCPVVNPLVYFQDPDERGEVMLKYLKSFESNNVDVLVKRQNTMQFLTDANEHCEDFFEKGFNFNKLGEAIGIPAE